MAYFDESRFRSQVDSALTKVATVLANTRKPTYAADVPHKYDDKFGLAEFLTNSGVAAELTVLELLGLSADGLQTILKWAQKRSVTLRLRAEERCEFIREEKKKVESNTEYVTEVKSSIFGKAKITDKTYTTVVEQYWKFDFEYELFAFRGSKATSEEDRVVLQARKGQIELKTVNGSKDSPPRSKVSVQPSIDVNITWLLQQLEPDSSKLKFTVDRNAKTCRTPRRNPEVEAALGWFFSFRSWCSSVNSYFRHTLFPAATSYAEEKATEIDNVSGSDVFVPVLPLFEEGVFQAPPDSAKSPRGDRKDKDKASKSSSSTALTVPGGALVLASGALSATTALTAVLPASDVAKFLQEQKRHLLEKISDFERIFPTSAKLITNKEATILLVVTHSERITDYFESGIDYLEFMLRKQLIAAIGKEVGPVDFANYMRFHQRKLYRLDFEPRPFSHAIRRPDHAPEGTVSIEQKAADGTMAEPVFTTCRHIPAAQATPMRFPISAAADVVFGGDRFLHAMILHEFEGVSGAQLSLYARARQFSSFILVVGRIGGPDLFEPKAAIIIQNKDELEIPLMLETIPTPKEFRDAIESLSPEQQRFCKAYRAMQLESTLFGLCILQIKPQLEKLLNLTYGSLTKEIRLTQDLMELFMKYQVPSDLLSFGGKPNVDAPGRIAEVKKHVKNMYAMVDESKKAAIEEARKVARYQAAENDRLLQSSLSSSGLMLDMADGGGYGGAIGGGGMSAQRDGGRSARGGAVKNEKRKKAKASAPLSKRADAGPVGSAAIAPTPPSEAPSSSSSSSTGTQATTQPHTNKDVAVVAEDEEIVAEDFTQIPTELDAKFEALDEDSALRPTIINLGHSWTKKHYESLLASQSTTYMSTTEQGEARDKAYDLLDALTRSGVLGFDAAELHVLIAATHCFDKSVIDTVIQDNVNPIEKVERSSLIVATTIHQKEATLLIKSDQTDRVRTYSPMLFAPAAVAAVEAPK